MSASNNDHEDHWSADAYQKAAAFVPKLASKVIQWLDPAPTDKILDIGCGDGILTVDLAKVLVSGSIHGIDSSTDMIRAAEKLSTTAANCTYEVVDGNAICDRPALQQGTFDKAFSNAALHWVLGQKSPAEHRAFFRGVNKALKPGGTLVFEMGGMGNVAEMRTALLGCVGRRVGMQRARAVDPWFFPDEAWVREILTHADSGVWSLEKSELEYRRTPTEPGAGGGIEGWVRVMGKQFFDNIAADGEERERCVREVVDNLETVCTSPSGGQWIGYVRLRVVARKA